MREREIFLAALELADPAARRAYLDSACAGRAGLRERVEVLLRSHAEADDFLDVPAMEQMAAAEGSLPFLSPATEPGTLGRLDHYEVLEVVGRGATGVVLKARDTKLQRVVAIKVLCPRLAANQAACQRFVGEAQAAAAIRDDHVVAIHAVSDERPVPYLVMEFIAGVTLEDVTRRDAPPDLREILRIGSQVANGLAAAHAQGLVHSDIKPANILLENGIQRVRITDFGLARAATIPAARGMIAGTPQFMSPEQARGEATDHRSDLFSFGSVLYALCTGRPPFAGGTTAEVLRHVCEDRPRPIRDINPSIPRWLCVLIDRLQSKDPGDRFATAREVAELLGNRLAREQRPEAAARRRRWWWFTAGTVGLLAATAALAAIVGVPWRTHAGSAGQTGETASPGYAGPVASLDLRREDIPPVVLALAGDGDPARAPSELAAVLGDKEFRVPRIGAILWMQQSPDEKILAVPLDANVVLFEAQTGRYLRTLTGPGGRVVWVSFSRDSQLLAASTWYEGWNGAVRVWDLRTDKELFSNPVPGPRVSGSSAFSADGRRLVGEGAGRLHVWDAQTGRELQTVPLEPAGYGRVCFSPDGRRLAVPLWNGKGVKVFDWDGNSLAEADTLKGHSDPVMTVAYSPDGKYLASGTEKEFKLWEAGSLREIGTVQTPAQELAFTPDSRTLYASATCARATPVHTWTRWDVGSRIELPALSVEVACEPHFATHSLSRSGKTLFVSQGAHHASYVRAIDTASGKDVFLHREHSAPINAIAVSPDGRTLATGGEDWVVKVWDLSDGRVLRSFAGHAGAVCGLAFSPDGTLLATGSRDGTIALRELRSGATVRALQGHSRSPSSIRFSPDGKTLAAGDELGAVKRWDVASGNEAGPLPGHSGGVRNVAFSPDGAWLASGGEDRSVRVHDLANGGSRKFPMPAAVIDVAFSSDGRTLAAACNAPEAPVRLWDVSTGQEAVLEGCAGPVRGLAFAPAAPLPATCAEDGTVQLWDLTDRKSRPRVIDLGRFPSGVRAVTFTPDGRYLVTANGNGTVYALRVGSS